MERAELPSRRVEAWKYSDLRAALAKVALPAEKPRPAYAWGKLDNVIERLAVAQDAHGLSKVRAGETEILIERVGAAAGVGLQARSREVQVLPGGMLTRIVLQAGGDVSLDVARILLSDGAAFHQFIIAEGANLARIETHVDVEGARCEVELSGLYLCGDGRHADLTSVVTHKTPGGNTKQLIKGVARKGGRGVFQGKIVVERSAQKTDARQYHHGMLLEEGAEIFAKPELMIHADDVACAHGNTAGGMDESALFYLRSRGVPGEEARALLTEAFLLEAVPGWLPVDVRREVEACIGAWLRGGT